MGYLGSRLRGNDGRGVQTLHRRGRKGAGQWANVAVLPATRVTTTTSPCWGHRQRPQRSHLPGRTEEGPKNQAPRPVEEPRRPSHSPSPRRRSALSRGAPCCAARRTHHSGPTGHRGATGIDQPIPSGKQRVTQQCEVMMLTLLDHPLSTAYRRNTILGGTNAPAKARQGNCSDFVRSVSPSGLTDSTVYL